jgi:predicted RNA-binding Zn ribbon-like protein
VAGEGPDDTGKIPQPRFYFLGGNLALDFHNTCLWTKEESASLERPVTGIDFLGSYTRLVDWGLQAGCLAERESAVLRLEAATFPEDAERALAAAVDLREVLHHVFSAIARGGKPESSALARLNAALADVMARLRVVPEGDGYAWGWSSSGILTTPLWPVTRAAAELLTAPDIRRVKRCGGDPCGFLFVDHSHRGRRWCDMGMCGSRAKSRRYYSRVREQRAVSDGLDPIPR